MDYKKYSLEQLNNWMYDAMSCGDATPQEIYDVIIGVVKDNYYTYKHQTSQAYELLALLNGNGGWTFEEVMKEKEYYEPSMPPWGHSDLEYLAQQRETDKKLFNCDKDNSSTECKSAWNDFWEEHHYPEEYKRTYDEMISDGYIMTADGFWIKEPKEDKVVKWQLPVELDGLTGECFVQFPDDLLEAANLKEGDEVNWIDRGDGSFELRKVTKPLEMDEC
jgi:hypothetical protein